MTPRALTLGLVAMLAGAPAAAVAAEPDDRQRQEDAMFGGGDEGEPDDRDEDAMFGADDSGDPDEDAMFGGGADPDSGGDGFEVAPDPLAIGGQLYLRLINQVYEGGGVEEQPLSMPSILDLYLDARPEERVRAFFNGRLRYDPTVSEGATDLFGQPVEAASVLVDQLWIKTDIARAVYLTVGQQRVKWGASRLWNPTDFVNSTQRDPLAVFDERTGVPLVKVHVPIESLGWNAYAFALLDSVEAAEDVGAALRLEMAFSRAELTLSGAFGKGRKTSLGADLSAGVGPLDVTLEVGLTDETDSLVYEGAFDIDQALIPTSKKRDAWVARGAVGLEYQFKPNDDDVMILGAEYFYNPLGYSDPDIYPWLMIVGAAQPFYLGEHYAALFFLVPSPGSWDDVSFTLSNLANLSDMSFVTRLDFSATLHTRLRLEAYAQVHYGERGGELRFELEVPDLPAIPGLLDDGLEGFTVPAPIATLGLNLRVSI